MPNPERRAAAVVRDANDAPLKTFEAKERSVHTSTPAQDQDTWLRELYTNDLGEMVCQICEHEMPFKKRNGEYYFEAVGAFDSLTREHHQNHLALCPVCAAKYKEFIKRDEAAALRCLEAINETEPDDPVVPLAFGDENATLRFVSSHLRDLKRIIATEASQTRDRSVHAGSTTSSFRSEVQR